MKNTWKCGFLFDFPWIVKGTFLESSNYKTMDRLQEKDRQIHVALYKNVHLLSTAYDNPKLCDGTRLQDHLHPDMFINTNKFAFEQIVYFILNSIDSDLIKNLAWPLLDKKLESEFRNKVKKILNDLNSKYEDVRIPTIQTSHMITPGGIKVAKILFYLSELAIIQCLEKLNNDDDDDEPTLLPFLASVNASNQFQNVDKVIQYKYKQLSETYLEIDDKTNETIKIAKNYSSQLLPLGEKVEELKGITNEINFSEFIEEFSNRLYELKEYETLIEQNQNVIHATVTNVKDPGFIYENNSCNIRQSILQKTQNNQNELNLMEFLKLIDSLLNDFILHLKQQPMTDLTQLDDLSIKVIQDYELFLQKFHNNFSPELQELNVLLRGNIERYNKELLKNLNIDNSYLSKLTTPEIQFKLPTTANQHFRTKLTATPSVRRISFFETLTTAKKRNKNSNDKKMAPTVKRNLMGDNKSAVSNPPSNTSDTMQSTTLSTSIVYNQPPNASSTPEIVQNQSPKLSNDRKLTSKIRQLLINEPLTEVSTPNASLNNISQDIFDILKLDDELDSSKLIANITKN